MHDGDTYVSQTNYDYEDNKYYPVGDGVYSHPETSGDFFYGDPSKNK